MYLQRMKLVKHLLHKTLKLTFVLWFIIYFHVGLYNFILLLLGASKCVSGPGLSGHMRGPVAPLTDLTFSRLSTLINSMTQNAF
jgi:hypothetical protein